MNPTLTSCISQSVTFVRMIYAEASRSPRLQQISAIYGLLGTGSPLATLTQAPQDRATVNAEEASTGSMTRMMMLLWYKVWWWYMCVCGGRSRCLVGSARAYNALKQYNIGACSTGSETRGDLLYLAWLSSCQNNDTASSDPSWSASRLSAKHFPRWVLSRIGNLPHTRYATCVPSYSFMQTCAVLRSNIQLNAERYVDLCDLIQLDAR